jgi:hypothetical protein
MSNDTSFALNINSDEYSAVSAFVNIFGYKVMGVRTLTYKQSVPRTAQNGMGSVSIGRTRGVYTASASIEILKRHGDIFKKRLQLKANELQLDGFADVPFNVETKFQEKNRLSAVDILGVKIQDMEEGIQTGGDAVVLKVELNIIRPIRETIDGVVCTMVRDPYDTQNGATIIVGGGIGITPNVSG